MRQNLDLTFLPLGAIPQIQPSDCFDRLGNWKMYEKWWILNLMALALNEESHFVGVLSWLHAHLGSAIRNSKQSH